MNIFKKGKLTSLFLAVVLSLSMFLVGCVDDENSSDLNDNSNSSEQSIDSNEQNTDSSEESEELSKEDTDSEKEDTSSDEQSTGSKEENTNSNEESTSDSLPENLEEAVVERVVDGDTVKVILGSTGEEVSLRLLLIDTPESVKPGVEPQPFSIEASDFAKKQLVKGDKIFLEYDKGSKTDKYNRHLCYLWYYSDEDKEWTMFNEKIVETGYARVGYIYSQTRHLDLLYKAQAIAKSKELNIWSVPGYVTDKGYNTSENSNSTSNSTTTSSSSNSSSSSSSSTSNKNTSNSSSSDKTVYVNGGASTSNKYHASSDAHGMKGAIKMKESEAKAKKHEACKLCY